MVNSSDSQAFGKFQRITSIKGISQIPRHSGNFLDYQAFGEFPLFPGIWEISQMTTEFPKFTGFWEIHQIPWNLKNFPDSKAHLGNSQISRQIGEFPILDFFKNCCHSLIITTQQFWLEVYINKNQNIGLINHLRDFSC